MKNIKISNAFIRELKPCYDPVEVIPEDELITLKEGVIKYRNSIKNLTDIFWLLLRDEIMSEKELRLFAVWCAREVLKLYENPDPRSVEACNVAERYANGEGSNEDLFNARCDARAAINDDDNPNFDSLYKSSTTAWSTLLTPAWVAACSAINESVREICGWYANSKTKNVLKNEQIDKLLTYFE